MSSKTCRHGWLITLVVLGVAASPARAYDWDAVVLEDDRTQIVFDSGRTPADIGSLRYAARFMRAASALVPDGFRLYVHCVAPDVQLESVTAEERLRPDVRSLRDALERHRERFERGFVDADWRRLRTCLAHAARFLHLATDGRFDITEQSARIYTLRVRARAGFWNTYYGTARLGSTWGSPAASGSLLTQHDEADYPTENVGLFLDRDDARASADRLSARGATVEIIDLTQTPADGFEMPEP